MQEQEQNLGILLDRESTDSTGNTLLDVNREKIGGEKS